MAEHSQDGSSTACRAAMHLTGSLPRWQNGKIGAEDRLIGTQRWGNEALELRGAPGGAGERRHTCVNYLCAPLLAVLAERDLQSQLVDMPRAALNRAPVRMPE
jgi:hypothetical protein